MAGADGTAVLAIEPPLRAPLPNGAALELAKPVVEGWLIDTVGWNLSVDRLVRLGGGIVIEEANGLP